MKLTKSFISMLALCLSTSAFAGDYKDVAYTEGTRYSELIITSRLSDFYANKKLMGLNVYDAQGQLVKGNAGGKDLKFDYVPGLVAKAVIEAAAYYSKEDFGRSCFYSVESYANTFADGVPTTGKSLDDLNATKMYATLVDLTKPGSGAFASIAQPNTYQNAFTAMNKATEGLADANKNFAITESVSKVACGGWWHKKSYPNQMWCDGQYMGPALLAQLISQGHTINGTTEDWKTIALQFDITWHYLWDKDKQLLWHAFSASPTDKYADSWADPTTGISQEYWGRACGWYFLALIDVLEIIPDNITMAPKQSSLKGYSKNVKKRLQQYLEKLATGLAARQDAKTGCWYQLLAYDDSFVADTYKGAKFDPVHNYLESSASALFTAGYLKGMRLGFLSKKKYMPLTEKAYKGFINQFFKQQQDGTYTLIDCCASAGLGAKDKRDGSAAYYLLGPDVTRVTTYTEGKVLGAFILASVEWERRNQK